MCVLVYLMHKGLTVLLQQSNGMLAAAWSFLADVKRGHGMLWDQLYISYDDHDFTYLCGCIFLLQKQTTGACFGSNLLCFSLC